MGAAAAPMLIGSAIGGLTNRDNPLQGALLGGALGGAGGAFMGSGGLSNMFSFADDAATGVLPSALSGSTTINANALPTGAVQAFTTGAPTATPLNVEAMKSAGGGLFAGSPVTAPFASSGTSTGLIPSSMYQPTFMDRVGSVGQFAQQNPVLTGMAMQSAQQMMQRPEVPMAPAGQVSRGQIQGGDYMSLLNPQQSTVLRPQPISLLG
jgi:hypothetical protein